MYRVVCIETAKKEWLEEGMPLVVKGNIYHVIEEFMNRKDYVQGKKRELGLYYILVEAGRMGYHNSLFVKINDEEIDETELVNTKEEVL